MKKEEIEILNKIKIGKTKDLEIILSESKEKQLTHQQILEVLNKIKKIRTRKNIKKLLWKIALENKPTEEIVKYSIENIKTLHNEEEYPSISDELLFSIHYLINKSNKNIFQMTMSKLLQSRSGEIRLIVAEYYFSKNQPEKALSIIIEILESLNIDHNVANAIEMDIAHYVDTNMLENLKVKHQNKDGNISQGLKYIISLMEAAILHSTNYECQLST